LTRGADVQDDTALQRFKNFKATIVSSNIPNDLLLEMIENYMTSDEDAGLVVESVPVLDGQMSLFDYELCA